MQDINKKWEYIKFSMQEKSVERAVRATPNSERMENIAEHTWSVSLIFWTFKEDFQKEFPQINVERIYDMIQIHDLGEILIQDLSTWIHKDKDSNRVSNEAEAMRKISGILGKEKETELQALYEELENLTTTEAKIVKGIDRISPVIQRFITNTSWKEANHSEADVDAIQLPKIGFSKTLLALYEIIKKEAKEAGLL